MFLQTTLNQPARILQDTQIRSLSQNSMRIKKHFKYEGQEEKAWKHLEREFMLHKQQMGIKSENGWSLTTQALWKRQN